MHFVDYASPQHLSCLQVTEAYLVLQNIVHPVDQLKSNRHYEVQSLTAAALQCVLPHQWHSQHKALRHYRYVASSRYKLDSLGSDLNDLHSH